MSLIIVGSCSKITQNIVLGLAKQSAYKTITISDLLPSYDFHKRYYRLRRLLKDQKSQTEVLLNKVIKTDDLYRDIQRHSDVLYVTHDYFSNVTSKTKLMELTAEFSKNKQRVVFATPIQYDHYGYQNPELDYLFSQKKVLETNPNSIFVRSDIQDTTELYSYLYKSKKIWEERLLQIPDSFRPKVVGAAFYAQKVIEALKSGKKGEVICVRGTRERLYTEVQHNNEIESYETDHQIGNIRLLVNKYKGPQDKHSNLVSFKF